MSNCDILLPTLDEGFKVTFLRRLYLPSLNLLSNPGFETAGVGDPDFWANWVESVGDGTLANETILVHEGSDACKITDGGSSNTWLSNTFTVVASKSHRLRFWTMGDGTNAGRYELYDVSNSGYIGVAKITTGITAAAYAMFLREFTTPVGCTQVFLRFWCTGVNGGVCYFDNCDVYLLN